MDSTKKVARKLAGQATGTAEWCTSVGNEYGQVLMSVLTAKEGCVLEAMTRGLVSRYSSACVNPPELLYVDRDCCSQTTKALFADWNDLHIRLDVWHFMRRIAAGCTADFHPLYKTFMGRLSQCIFQWDKQDLALMKEAKRQELITVGVEQPSEEAVMKRMSQCDLAQHCRRATRQPEDIARLVQQLLEVYDSDQGRDTMGVPLLNSERVWDEWKKARQHVACLQDPPRIQLYTELGTTRVGGMELKTYRCARASTSLESFHLHLTRFIPGTSANDLHFQAYLLEGLVQWNEDRAQSVTKDCRPSSCSKQGELIGVEYLYQQTGRALQDLKQEEEEDTDDEEGVMEAARDEGFEEGHVDDLTIASADVVLPDCPSVSRPKPGISSDISASSILAHQDSHASLRLCEPAPSTSQKESGESLDQTALMDMTRCASSPHTSSPYTIRQCLFQARKQLILLAFGMT